MHENLYAIIFKYSPNIRECLPAIKIITAFILGARVGSLTNTLALRIVDEGRQRVIKCHVCNSKCELSGVISALLRLEMPGKCRTCGAGKLNRSILVELFSAVICVLFVWRFGVSFAFVFALVTLAFWILHSLTDIENGYIYDLEILAMTVSGALFRLWGGAPALIDGAFGAGIGFGAVFVIIFLTRGAIGTGDAMLMLGTGALIGWRLTLATLYFGFIIGGVYVIPLLLAKKLRAKDSLPLAPFFTLGGLVSIFAGKWIYALFGISLMWPW